MKLILREQKGTKRFVFIQKKNGSVVTCSAVWIPVTIFLSLLVSIWIFDSPPSPTQFLVIIGLFFISLGFDFSSILSWDADKDKKPEE